MSTLKAVIERANKAKLSNEERNLFCLFCMLKYDLYAEETQLDYDSIFKLHRDLEDIPSNEELSFYLKELDLLYSNNHQFFQSILEGVESMERRNLVIGLVKDYTSFEPFSVYDLINQFILGFEIENQPLEELNPSYIQYIDHILSEQECDPLGLKSEVVIDSLWFIHLIPQIEFKTVLSTSHNLDLIKLLSVPYTRDIIQIEKYNWDHIDSECQTTVLTSQSNSNLFNYHSKYHSFLFDRFGEKDFYNYLINLNKQEILHPFEIDEFQLEDNQILDYMDAISFLPNGWNISYFSIDISKDIQLYNLTNFDKFNQESLKSPFVKTEMNHKKFKEKLHHNSFLLGDKVFIPKLQYITKNFSDCLSPISNYSADKQEKAFEMDWSNRQGGYLQSDTLKLQEAKEGQLLSCLDNSDGYILFVNTSSEAMFSLMKATEGIPIISNDLYVFELRSEFLESEEFFLPEYLIYELNKPKFRLKVLSDLKDDKDLLQSLSELEVNFPETSIQRMKISKDSYTSYLLQNQKIKEQLSKTEESANEMLSVIRHQLAGPVRNIKSDVRRVNRIVSKYVEQNGEDLMKLRLHKEGRNLEYLLSDLISNSEYISDYLTFVNGAIIQPFELENLNISDFLNSYNTVNEIDGISFSTERDFVQLDILVDFNKEKLKEVLDNMLENAVKHAFDSKSQNTFMLSSELSEHGDKIYIYVANSGKALSKGFSIKNLGLYRWKANSKGDGTGGYLIYQNLLKMGAKLSFDRIDKGNLVTEFIIEFDIN